MLPQTTLEMKAPSLLCAAAYSRIPFGNTAPYFTCTCQWTGAFYFSKIIFYSVCSIFLLYKNTLSHFGPDIIPICNKSDQNYTNSLTSPSMSSRYDLI